MGVEHFQSGLNNVEITVSHDVCGRAGLNLEFHIPDPPEGKLKKNLYTISKLNILQYAEYPVPIVSWMVS